MRYYLCVKLRYRRWSLGCGWRTCYLTRCYPLGSCNYLERHFILNLSDLKNWLSKFCYSNFKYSAYPVRAYVKGFRNFSHSAPLRINGYTGKLIFGHYIRSCGYIPAYLSFEGCFDDLRG